MNDKITKQKMYTDFSIRLDKLEYMLEKILSALESKAVNNVSVSAARDWNFEGIIKEMEKEFLGGKPSQWPNESYIDYMKRIGELNTAQSDEEAFTEECK